MFSLAEFSGHEDLCAVGFGKETETITHCGLLYKVTTGGKTNCFMIGLGLPKELINDSEAEYVESKKHYLWKNFQNVPDEIKSLIASKCFVIYEMNKTRGLQYGIFYDENTRFDANGVLFLGENADGLTCGTFVMTLLKGSGINLIDETEWPDERAGDEEWLLSCVSSFEVYIEKMKVRLKELNLKYKLASRSAQSGINIDRQKLINCLREWEEVIGRLKEGKDCVFKRFRPEEVAAAAYEDFASLPMFFHCKGYVLGACCLGKHLFDSIRFTR